MTPEHLHAVTSFLAHVGNATGFPMNIDPKAKMADMAVMLAEKYPNTAMFADKAATFVAFECGMTIMPSVAIIGRLLEKWWSKNRPAQVALPGAGDDMSQADRAMIRFWGDYRTGVKPMPRGVTLVTSLSMMRQHKPDAFAYVVKTDDEARRIAEQQGWIREPREPTPTQEAIEAVHRAIRSGVALSEDFGDPPSTLAPEQAVVRSQGEPGRRQGGLTPEQTHALRMANPLLRPIAEQQALAEVEVKLAAEHPAMRRVPEPVGAFHAPWHED